MEGWLVGQVEAVAFTWEGAAAPCRGSTTGLSARSPLDARSWSAVGGVHGLGRSAADRGLWLCGRGCLVVGVGVLLA